FPQERCEDALAAVFDLSNDLEARKPRPRLKLDLSANLHLAVVAEGEFGPDEDRRYDVLGSGVNHLFTMGAGAGVRISEAVSRHLPADRRRPWQKHRPPATYSFSSSRSP